MGEDFFEVVVLAVCTNLPRSAILTEGSSWCRRDGQSNDNLHFVSGTTGGSGDVARVEDMINELTAHAARLRSELVALHSKMDETSDRLVSNVKQNIVEDESPVTV